MDDEIILNTFARTDLYTIVAYCVKLNLFEYEILRYLDLKLNEKKKKLSIAATIVFIILNNNVVIYKSR